MPEKSRIICLHGYRQNKDIFKSKLGAFRKLLKKDVETYFMDAPNVLSSTEINAEERSWWFTNENRTFDSRIHTDICIGFEESVNALKIFISEEGPFDGILGFSQGAAFLSIIAAMKQHGEFLENFKFVILVSGFKLKDDLYIKYYNTKIEVPSLHVIGENDEVIYKCDTEFSDLCFAFGLELDEVVVEKNDSSVEEIIYKIDIPANRYDLLCLEGLSTALLIFQNKLELPLFKLLPVSQSCLLVNVCSSAKEIRPYIVAAVLRNVTLTPERYNSFIDFQDKLHHNICRKRSLVAIGTHDLDKITPPIFYEAKSPDDIKFRALNQDEEHTAAELMELFTSHAQLKQYLPIIRDSPVYPIVKDSKDVILSLPPVINSHHSRITLDTKNIFIECTATDLTKAITVLDMLTCAFSQYCDEKYSVECCKVISNGETKLYPELKYRKENISVKKINKYLGISASGSELADLLSRMCLKSEVSKIGSDILVEVPPLRHDVIHQCDIIEDAAIAFGYNNIPRTFPQVSTVANQFPLNKLTEQLRQHVAFNGFFEALSFSLCSRDDISSKLKKELDSLQAVHISNPKTFEFQVARTLLLPGLLKTLASNKQMPLPLKLFEVSDVVLKDAFEGVGARNERHLCVVYCNKTSGFEIVHGLFDIIMEMLEVPRHIYNGYYIRSVEDETYFPGRCAEILYKQKPIGKMGILHPDVITEFELTLPCSSFEFNIEPFV